MTPRYVLTSAVFGVTLNKELAAVNVGTKDDPIWYAQELLKIMPYQVYNHLLPGDLTSGMIRAACKGPSETRARIEQEGLGGLGITDLENPTHLVSSPHTLRNPTNCITCSPVALHSSFIPKCLGFPLENSDCRRSATLRR